MTEAVGTTRGAGTSERAIQLERGFRNALAGAGAPGIVAFLDPDLKCRAPESLPWEGTLRCHDGFHEFSGQLLEQPAEFGREAVDHLHLADWVVVLLRQMGGRKGADSGYDAAGVDLSAIGVEMGIRESTIVHLVEALLTVEPIVPAAAWATEPGQVAA